MYNFLERINSEDLCGFLLKSTKVSFPIQSELNRGLLNNLIFAWYGYDVLYEKGIRRLLLQTLPATQLLKLAEELNINKNQKTYDIITSLSILQWKTNSSVSWAFEKFFKIPLEFLPTKSQRSDPYEIIHPFVPPPKLFPYQKETANRIIEFFQDSKSKCCLVQLPTGGGKTRTTVEAIVEYCNSNNSSLTDPGVIWMAHTEELCEQAIDSFKKVWQSKATQEKLIVRFWGDHKINIKEILGSITICGYSKLSALYSKEPEQFNDLLAHSRILVIDEAHKALAPRTKEIIKQVKISKNMKIVGLTATPGRSGEKKEENRGLANLFEKNLITPTTIGDDAFKFLQTAGVISKIKRQTLHSGISIQLSEKDMQYHNIETDFRSVILKNLVLMEIC